MDERAVRIGRNADGLIDASDPTERQEPESRGAAASVADAASAADAYMPTGDTLATYMREMRRVDRLTREEVATLSRARRELDEQAADWVRALALRTGVVDGPYGSSVGNRLREDVRVSMCGCNAGAVGTIESYYEIVRALRERYLDELHDASNSDVRDALDSWFGPVQLRCVSAVFSALQVERAALRKALRMVRSNGRGRREIASVEGDALAKKRAERARLKLAELSRTLVLPLEELTAIVTGMSELLQGSRDIVDRLAETNLRLVLSIARRYTSDPNTLLDLVQEGSLALMNAAKYFDPERGYTFGTFAATAIRRQLGQYLAKESTVLNASQGMHQRDRQVRAAREAVRTDVQSNGVGHEPTLEELAQYLGTSTENVVRTIDAVQTAASLDAPIGEGRTQRIDTIADSNSEDPCDTLDAYESFVAMRSALSLLTERERRVLEQRYLDDSAMVDTLQGIGDSLGITRERVRQIECRALNKLRCPK